ncbi:hypothetical protein [Dyadobacter sp. LHD-138]|uniref:hypothetical protein n=1 Tax=Dyadobacter sp. LHD-138 TaxID=3071413 RepID=UPI0027E0D4B4|nr:hypothetical protein [Dyadobacter sp. LHD-138]MDQ6476842.1 hypothetical protein [Dyadobacter sp. LHD-138]
MKLWQTTIRLLVVPKYHLYQLPNPEGIDNIVEMKQPARTRNAVKGTDSNIYHLHNPKGMNNIVEMKQRTGM